jgi:adenylate cyclase
VPVITHCNGTRERFTGDAIMTAFGAPVTHENDPEHAVRAAVEMHRSTQ